MISPGSSHPQTAPLNLSAPSRPRLTAADIEPCAIEDLSLPKQLGSTTVDAQTSVHSEITEPTPSSSNLTVSARTSEPSEERSEPLLQPKLLVDALRESSVMLLEDLGDRVGKIPGSPALKNVIGATLGVCTGALLYAFPAHSLGALGTLSVFAALGFEKNHHSRAQGIVGGILWSAHFVAMDVPSAAICTIVATARTIFQAMLPEDQTCARSVVAALGFGVAAATCSLFTSLLPLAQLGNIPLLTTALGSLAGAFNQKYSWATRLCGLAGTVTSIPYHIFESQSAAGLIINLVILPRIVSSIWRYDIARKPEGGEG